MPRRLSLILGLALVAGVVGTAAAQSTSTETKQFEILSVDGNQVVVKGATGVTQEITVPPDFKLSVDGRPVTVGELRPGMKGTATITTTTKVVPVHVTEVKNGVVMQKVGNSIIVRTEDGIKMFSEGDVTKRGIKLTRGGQPFDFNDLHEGDRLAATIITEGPPKVMTERQVEASMASVKRAAAATQASAAPSSAPGGASASASTGATASAGRRLPKTASPLPLLGLAGAASLTLGALLTLRRRRAS